MIPRSVLMSVVLPAPLGPTTPHQSPCAIDRLMPDSSAGLSGDLTEHRLVLVRLGHDQLHAVLGHLRDELGLLVTVGQVVEIPDREYERLGWLDVAQDLQPVPPRQIRPAAMGADNPHA